MLSWKCQQGTQQRQSVSVSVIVSPTVSQFLALGLISYVCCVPWFLICQKEVVIPKCGEG